MNIDQQTHSSHFTVTPSSLGSSFYTTIATLAFGIVWILFASTLSAAEDHYISFDLPPTAVAVPVSTMSEQSSNLFGGGENVEVTLQLSSLVCGSQVPDIDRWMIRCVPRSTQWRVADYSPRTETGSDYDGSIEVKTRDEQTKSLGMSVDATPVSFGGAHAGFDTSDKESESLTYRRQAPLHAVTASGTIERGRGVYYKLRWTSTQVLEGEKQFKVTFRVPVGFRAGLLDVSVVALGRPAGGSKFSQIPMLGDSVDRVRPIGEGRFVVAVHAEGDPVAWRAAKLMADTEQVLRDEASKIRAPSPTHSLSTLIRHVAAKIDIESDNIPNGWVDRLIFGSADPYTDSMIRRLPTRTRVVALDYCDARRKLVSLKTRQTPATDADALLTDWVETTIAQ